MEKYVKIPVPVMQAVVTYLETQPFKEVAQLLQGIIQGQKPVEPEKDAE